MRETVDAANDRDGEFGLGLPNQGEVFGHRVGRHVLGNVFIAVPVVAHRSVYMRVALYIIDNLLFEDGLKHHGSGTAFFEFAQVVSRDEIRMRVWERGSGITMACGTGACATTAAAAQEGLCPQGMPVTVHLDGGDLHIRVRGDYDITMTGPATTVYEGEVEL